MLAPHAERGSAGEYSQGCLRSKNSGSPTLSAFISSIWACNGYATSSPGDDPQQITRQVARYLF